MYVQIILKEEGMKDYTLVVISVTDFFIALNKSEDKEESDMWSYKAIIEKLMYLVCRSWSDISFVVRCLSQNNSDLWVSHVKTVKQVLWYLQETAKYCIVYI